MKTILISFFLLLLQQVLAHQEPALLECKPAELRQLGDDCRLLKRFNLTEIELMEFGQLESLADHCACQLANMDSMWADCFDFAETRRLRVMVERAASANQSAPDYLWTDSDVTNLRVSIQTVTSDFFQQLKSNKLPFAHDLRLQLEASPVWRKVRSVCREVARDKYRLYRYLENLNRLSARAFLKLIDYDNFIAEIYQASKACKLLVHQKLSAFKLQPDGAPDLVVADPTSEQANSANLAQLDALNDIDLMLKDSSAWLLNCTRWQTSQSSVEQLARDCPMMVGEQVPSEWLQRQSSPMDRTMAATQCGCQLLMHNATWAAFLQDKNIKLMSKALTNHLNNDRIPNFADSPIWVIHGWFQDVMSRFVKSKKFTVKEMIKASRNDQDPSSITSQHDYETALEALRRGCNYIMFNYNKGAKEAIELKLIKYLDNLQLISQDPMFVFHLTLQDPNLFKLHALSRMCIPVIR